jgi:hypothetical protein
VSFPVPPRSAVLSCLGKKRLPVFASLLILTLQLCSAPVWVVSFGGLTWQPVRLAFERPCERSLDRADN